MCGLKNCKSHMCYKCQKRHKCYKKATSATKWSIWVNTGRLASNSFKIVPNTAAPSYAGRLIYRGIGYCIS